MNKIKYYKGNEQMAVQGDVIAVAVKAEGVSFKPLSKDGYVIAVGETTGNLHKIVAEREAIIEIAEDKHGAFIRVLKGSAILTGHKEHSDITTKVAPKVLTVGEWFVGRQDEYDPLKKWRQVGD